MRTYQRVNASNGFDAVGNMLVVGTSFIWVPLLAVYLGYLFVQGKMEDSRKEKAAAHAAQVQRAYEQSPEGKLAAAVAKEKREKEEADRIAKEAEYNARLTAGIADFHKLKIGTLTHSDRYTLKPRWEAVKGIHHYTLTDETCRYAGTTDRKLGFRMATHTDGDEYRNGTKIIHSACYQVRGDVVYVFDMNRGTHLLREDFKEK